MTKKQKQKEQLHSIQSILHECQKLLISAERMLADVNGEETDEEARKKESGADQFLPDTHQGGEEVIEGVFNGREMQAQGGALYPVPENYASKSRLVEGDRLKLTITREGRFVFKQIGPIPRESLKGFLHYTPEEDRYSVLAEGKSYMVLAAPITYFKGETGDEVSIIVPQGRIAAWAAVEAVMKHGTVGDVLQKSAQPAPSSAGLEEI